ncbi:MAG: hypothetical protein JNJ45_06370 [Chthonomonas sp.]|nr:hypothetical protein [Chthonomonas sp.]
MRSSCITVALLAVFGTVGSVTYAGDAPVESATSVGGKTAMDLIRLETGSPSVILRNAGVLPGSEQVEVDGRLLRRGTDYSIDNGSGVVYLMFPPKTGQSARVTYRFDLTLAGKYADASKKLGVANALTFNLTGGSKMVMGLGMAERGADGSITSSNLLGLRNNFSMGGGVRMSGFMGVTQRKKVQSSSMIETGQKDAAVNEEASQAMIQNMDWSLGPGKLSLDYQDIGSKFDGVSTLMASGYTEGEASAFAKEKGLKRSGVQGKDLKVGGLSFSGAQRMVTDGNNEIDWRSYSVKAGAFEASFDRRQVDKQFKRFKDLKEGDRNELAKEAGLTRENVGFGFKSGASNFSASNMVVKDEAGAGFARNNYTAQFGKYKISLGHQSVDQGFTNFNGLREGDRGQLARERGLNRDTLAFEGNGLKYATSSVSEDANGSEFEAQDITLGAKGFSFTRILRSRDKKFEALGSMADGELDGHVKSIAMMYEPQDFWVKPESRMELVNGARIDREMNRLQWTPKTGINLIADTIKLGGEKGNGEVNRFGLQTKNASYSFKQQKFDGSFSEAASLMEFERQRLGVDAGLNKTDQSMSLQMGKSGQLNASTMSANIDGQGSASKTQVGFKGKGLEFSANQREVGSGFEAVNNLVDPERDLMRSLRGYKQKDYALNWSMIRGLGLSMKQSDSYNEETKTSRMFGEQVLGFQPDAQTKFELFKFRQQDMVGAELSYLNTIDRLSVARQMRNLTAKYESERVTFDGTQTTAPSSDRRTFGITAQVDPKTSIGTEQTRIEFSDGSNDQISSHSISKDINGKVGVSVTETSVNRSGDRPDEQNRNYGVWIDLGSGLRLNYGQVRATNSTAAGTMSSQASLTGGTVGNVKIDNAAYNDQRWDGTRYQSTGNVGFGLVRPMNLGLFRNFTFGLKADTFRDYQRFQRENRWVGAAASILGTDVKFDYNSQIAPTGERAIDRSFRFGTPKSDKSPLSLAVFYKVRTMPSQKSFAIRDYNLSWKPTKGVSLTHQLQTNPEVARGDMLLGSLPQAARSSKWRLDFNGSAATKLGLAWDEFRDDTSKNLSRVAGLNMTLFSNNPSPLNLYYGFEHNEKGNHKRTAHRYHLRFDQRPGPNQSLSLFLGNVSWQNSRDAQFKVQNWSARGEFSVRF